MSDQHRWRDALGMAQRLEHCERERWVLEMLARLPFASEELLEHLAGVKHRGLYRTIERLTRSRLVGAILPSFIAGRSPLLHYLTDLGVATLAVLYRVEPGPMARGMRITRKHLIRLVPMLHSLYASYRLLGAIAASRSQPANLLNWERPWRRRYVRTTASASSSVQLPAFARLSWNGGTIQCLLVPDQGLVPMRFYRAALDRLLVIRAMDSGHLPALVVATNAGRRTRAWKAALQETAEAHREAPLDTCIANWSDLDAGLRTLPTCESGPEQENPSSVRSAGVPELKHPPGGGRLPQIVGSLREIELESQGDEEELARASLALSPSDRRLLDLVGRHPFLSAAQLAMLVDRPERTIRSQCRRLQSFGLIRMVGPEEMPWNRRTTVNTEPGLRLATKFGTGDRPDLSELTQAGLALLAAQCGLSAKAAVRFISLAGGGPERPFGPRAQLLGQIEHTVRANEVFVDLVRSLRQAFRNGAEESVITWRSAAASTRGTLRPDWYAIVDRGPVSFGFFLEYDRGTESARDYRRKFSAYYAYLLTGRFGRDYEDFPVVLMVTTTHAAERRIARAARSAFVGREQRLPLFLTSEWRIVDRNNPLGLLGPIWWEPTAEFNERRALPTTPAAIQRHATPWPHPRSAHERSRR